MRLSRSIAKTPPPSPGVLPPLIPKDTRWQVDLPVSYERLGDVWMARGKLNEALKAYQDGLAIRERLIATDPNNTLWQRNLSISQASAFASPHTRRLP